MKVRAGKHIAKASEYGQMELTLHYRTDLGHRKCQACGEIKPANAFSTDKRWLRRVCKACRAGKERARYSFDETTSDQRLNAWFSGKWKIKVGEGA